MILRHTRTHPDFNTINDGHWLAEQQWPGASRTVVRNPGQDYDGDFLHPLYRWFEGPYLVAEFRAGFKAGGLSWQMAWVAKGEGECLDRFHPVPERDTLSQGYLGRGWDAVPEVKTPGPATLLEAAS